MYINSIVLDGFKSYGNRVEVIGFDAEFNAITGMALESQIYTHLLNVLSMVVEAARTRMYEGKKQAA